MTRTIVQEVEVPTRIVRLSDVLARTGPGAEHDLRAGGRRELSPTNPARRPRRRLARIRGGCVDPRTDRREPWQLGVI